MALRKSLQASVLIGVAVFFNIACARHEAAVQAAKNGATVALLKSLSQALKSYDMEFSFPFDEYPFDSNAKIFRTLTGDNSRKQIFIEFSPQSIDANSLEITDSWGTPIRFTPRSHALPAIRSAGADRQFDTSDDIVSDDVSE